MKYIITFIFILSVSYTYCQTISKNWEKDLNDLMAEFKSCNQDKRMAINHCHQYFGKALHSIYQVNDFYSENLKRYRVVNEIAHFLDSNEKWKLMGKCYDQKTLTEAQDLANAGKAVVAIYLDEEGLGHLSIILPGKLKISGTWGLNVPNSSSFFSVNPEKSYINKALSYAFMRSQITKVKLYARND